MTHNREGRVVLINDSFLHNKMEVQRDVKV